MAEIWDYMDCVGCSSFKLYVGKTQGDPYNCYPDESECSEGDFGRNYLCSRILARLGEGLRDGDFSFSNSFLTEARYLTDPEMRSDYADVLEARPDVDWSEHSYWQIFYDATAPEGFDTLKEIYEKVFC
jgi:hypothetical protein